MQQGDVRQGNCWAGLGRLRWLKPSRKPLGGGDLGAEGSFLQGTFAEKGPLVRSRAITRLPLAMGEVPQR